MFYSILFPDADSNSSFCNKEPDCFRDLNLDQIFNPIIEAEKVFNIGSFFYTPLKSSKTISYRQSIMADLILPDLKASLDEFSREIFTINSGMSKLSTNSDKILEKGHFLDYGERYCNAISSLATNNSIKSQGLSNFFDYISEYSKSQFFSDFSTAVKNVRSSFSKLQYSMFIKNGAIKVRKYEGEKDLSADVAAAFDKFKGTGNKNYSQRISEAPHALFVEEGVLALLTKTFPKEFEALNKLYSKYFDFVDKTIARFAKEIRFYISWLNYIEDISRTGLKFCFPSIHQTGRIFCNGFYDLAFAKSRGDTAGTDVVPNDFYLEEPERIIVITGPNQGGKTTFARAFGQINYLFSLGLSVPGINASLPLNDGILTHFEREESFNSQKGKLEDDLSRLHTLSRQATPDSIIIVNEIFSSTTLTDAIKLGSHMMDNFASLGAVCVVVTFMDELAKHGPESVSMMSTVAEGSDERTFKVVRRPPDGVAHALYIAEKYGLTYEKLSGRLNHEC